MTLKKNGKNEKRNGKVCDLKFVRKKTPKKVIPTPFLPTINHSKVTKLINPGRPKSMKGTGKKIRTMCLLTVLAKAVIHYLLKTTIFKDLVKLL